MPAPKGPRDRLSAARRRGRPPKDPIDEGFAVARAETKKLVQLVITRVPYTLFAAKKIPMDTFNRVRDVAMTDAFFSLSDGDLRQKLGVSQEYLDAQREHPQYEAIKRALQKVARDLGKTKGMNEFAAEVEPQVAHEMFLVGMNAGSDRDKLAGLAAFVDRTSPKQSRQARDDGDSGRAPQLPDKFLDTIQMALQLAASFQGGGPAGPIIDATVLNVPKRALPAPTEGES